MRKKMISLEKVFAIFASNLGQSCCLFDIRDVHSANQDGRSDDGVHIVAWLKFNALILNLASFGHDLDLQPDIHSF